jgi:RHS repeat-associated protein
MQCIGVFGVDLLSLGLISGATIMIGVRLHAICAEVFKPWGGRARSCCSPRLTILLLGGLALSTAAVGAETVTYYYSNPQGTVLVRADGTGNTISSSDYRPYGSQVLGSPEHGPGYAGHENDVDSGLVYMKARYYDPIAGTFISVDPKPAGAGSPLSFGRYAYANGNPVLLVDPDGQASQLYWTSSNTVTYVLPYVLDTRLAPSPVTHADIQSGIHSAWTGSVSLNGQTVHVEAFAIQSDNKGKYGDFNTVKMVPNTDTVTQTGRAETNEVGGNFIIIGATGENAGTQGTFNHELGGHAGHAGDLYATGRDVNGNKLQKDVPGASGVMYDGRGHASDESMRQILNSSTTPNICAPGVHAANGGC